MANDEDFFDNLIKGEVDETPQSTSHRLANLLSDDESGDELLRLVESVEAYNTRQDHDLLLPTLSLEAFGQTDISSMIKAIVEWLKSLIDAMFDEMTALGVTAYHLKRKAEDLKILSRDRRLKPVSQSSFVVNTRTVNLHVRYRPITTVYELMTQLKVLAETVKVFYNYDPLSQVQSVVATSLQPDSVSALVAKLHSVSPHNLTVGNRVFTPHSSIDGWSVSPQLLGNHRLLIKNRLEGTDYEKINGASVRLVHAEMNPKPVSLEIEFTRFGLSQSDQCLNLISSICDTLIDAGSMASRSKRSQALNQVRSALDRLMQKAKITGDEGSAEIKQTVALLEQYINWSVNPYNGLYGLTCRNLKAALNVCALNTQ